MEFEWDEHKNASSIAKHGISLANAARIFEGLVLTDIDPRFHYGEVREISIGKVADAVIVTVVHTQRDGKIRLISARPANRGERNRYEEALRTRTQP